VCEELWLSWAVVCLLAAAQVHMMRCAAVSSYVSAAIVEIITCCCSLHYSGVFCESQATVVAEWLLDCD